MENHNLCSVPLLFAVSPAHNLNRSTKKGKGTNGLFFKTDLSAFITLDGIKIIQILAECVLPTGESRSACIMYNIKTETDTN